MSLHQLAVEICASSLDPDLMVLLKKLRGPGGSFGCLRLEFYDTSVINCQIDSAWRSHDCLCD